MRIQKIITLFIFSFISLAGFALQSNAADGVFTVAGFPVVLEDYSLKAQDGVLVFNGKGTIDLSSALGAGVVVSSDEVVMDSTGKGVFKNVSASAKVQAGDLAGSIAAGDIEFSADSPDPIYVKVAIDVNVGGTKTQTVATLPVTSAGVQDTKIAIPPSQGSDALLSKTAGDAEIVVKSGSMSVSGGQFTNPEFTGSLKFFGSEMKISNLVVSDTITGKTSGNIKVGEFGLSLPGIDFSYSELQGFKAQIPRATIDTSSVLPGARPVTVTNLSFEQGVFRGEADISQDISIDGAKLSITHIAVDSSSQLAGQALVRAKLDGSVKFDGSDSGIPFTGLEIDSGGNVKGEVSLPQPQTVVILGMNQSVDSIEFAREAGALSVGVSGSMGVGDNSISFSGLGMKGGKLSGQFDVSESSPLEFSWMPYLKITALSIENDALKFSGSVDVPAPFSYKLQFKNVEIGADGRAAGDVVSSTREEAQKAWKKTSSPALVTLENDSSESVTLKGYTFRLDAVTIPNPIYILKGGAPPDTLVKLYMRSEISLGGGEKVELNVDGIEFTKSGLKDLTLVLQSASGDGKMVSKEVGDWAKIEVESGLFSIKGGKFDYMGLNGAKVSVPPLDLEMDIGKLDIGSDGAMSAKAAFQDPVEIKKIGLSFDLKEVSLDWQPQQKPEIAAAGEISVGDFKVPFKKLAFNNGKINLTADASESDPLEFSWMPFLKITDFKIESSVIKMDGRIEMPSPFEYTFKFEGMEIDEDGTVRNTRGSPSDGGGKPWDELSDPSLITFENANDEPFSIAGFDFRVKALVIPNPFKAEESGKIPDTIAHVFMNAETPLNGKKISVDLNNLEIAKSGFKNLSLDVSPPSGEDSFFTQDFAGIASVRIKKVSLEIKDGSFDSLGLSGTLSMDLPKVDAEITSIKIDADKNIIGAASFEETPLELSAFGLGIAISSIDFEIKGSSDISVDLAGEAVFLDDKIEISSLKIDGDGVSAKFDVSDDDPFSFSWFPYLKITQLEISDSELLLGGKIESPSPVEYSFEFKDVKFDKDGDVMKAVEEGAENAWDELASDDMIAIENTNEDPLTIAGFSFYINAIAIPNPMVAVRSKSLPDTLLQLFMKVELPIGEKKMAVAVNGLEVTKNGLKDIDLAITPPDGEESLYSATFLDWAAFKVDSANIKVEGGEFDSFTFDGAVTFDGYGFSINELAMGKSALTGKLKPIGDPSIKLGGIKLDFGDDISFSIATSSPEGEKEGANDAGSDKPDSGPSSQFAVSFKNITVDFSELLGSDSAKIKFDEIAYNDGNISVEKTSAISLDISGIKLEVSNMLFASNLPGKGKSRAFNISLDGKLGILNNEVSLQFDDFMISSEGAINATIKPASLQSFDLYIMAFSIKQFTISKKAGESLKLSLAGSFSVAKSSAIEFDDLTYADGKVSFSVTRSEKDAIELPLCKFVKITKFEVKDNKLSLSGFMDVPVLAFRLVAKDITISSKGGVESGELKLASAAKIDFGALVINIDAASFDLKTMYLTYSGSIALPSDILSGTFTFKNMGVQLYKTGGYSQDSSKANIGAPSSINDKKHGLPIQITKTSIDFSNTRFILSINGSATFMGKFTLNVENFQIAFYPGDPKNVNFYMGTVTGAIEVASFRVEITEFKIDDRSSDPSVRISGGMKLPQFGSIKVTGLQIYKSGKISLEGVSIYMDKGVYKVGAEISYVNGTFKGAGTITFSGKRIDVAVLFSSSEFKIDVSVTGLDIMVFPGLTVDGIGGGVHCIYDPFWMEFKISGDLGLGSGKAVKGRATLTIATNGVISVMGELFIADSIKLGEAKVTVDMPNKTVSGYAKINATFGGILNVNVQVNIYVSPDTWYVKGVGTASIISVNLGTVNLSASSSGFFLSGNFSYSSGRISASLSFSFKIYSVTNFSVSCTGSGKVDLWIVSVSASISLNGTFNGSELYASASVRGCVRIVFWDKCASATVKVRMNSGGLSISVD